jgi:hypothetical protein
MAQRRVCHTFGGADEPVWPDLNLPSTSATLRRSAIGRAGEAGLSERAVLRRDLKALVAFMEYKVGH